MEVTDTKFGFTNLGGLHMLDTTWSNQFMTHQTTKRKKKTMKITNLELMPHEKPPVDFQISVISAITDKRPENQGQQLSGLFKKQMSNLTLHANAQSSTERLKDVSCKTVK